MTHLEALNLWNKRHHPLPGYEVADTCRHRPEDRLFVVLRQKKVIGAVTEDGHALSKGGLEFFYRMRQKFRRDRQQRQERSAHA
ncbi:MAG: hypothetical protein JXR59_04015 [Desulfuromonadaceae bacterium]|nr:hypothetical protein [Desulfuromonadaceae bacterium]